MNIEEIKHLFVPVTERLPEQNGMYLILPHDATKPYVDYWDKNSFTAFPYKHIYGWLDFSILTTKSRAVELAKKSFYFANSEIVDRCFNKGLSSAGIFNNFITENKNTL